MSEPMKRAGVFVIGLCTVAVGAGLAWALIAASPAPSAPGRGVLLGLAALLVVPPAVIAALKAAGRTDRA